MVTSVKESTDSVDIKKEDDRTDSDDDDEIIIIAVDSTGISN